jgi:hypothetical protein
VDFVENADGAFKLLFDRKILKRTNTSPEPAEKRKTARGGAEKTGKTQRSVV